MCILLWHVAKVTKATRACHCPYTNIIATYNKHNEKGFQQVVRMQQDYVYKEMSQQLLIPSLQCSTFIYYME